MPVIAVMVATPAPLCVERQRPRPANRTVPADTVFKQHKAMVHSHPQLKAEGFNEVVFADSLYRLLPYLERLSQARTADLGLDGGDGLGDLLLVSRTFGPQILPAVAVEGRLRHRRRRPRRAAPPRTAVPHPRPAHRTWTVRATSASTLPCPARSTTNAPATPGCPAYSVTCLFRALNGDLDTSEDIVCTVHGGFDDVDQEDDDHAAAVLEEQVLEAIRS